MPSPRNTRDWASPCWSGVVQTISLRLRGVTSFDAVGHRKIYIWNLNGFTCCNPERPWPWYLPFTMANSHIRRFSVQMVQSNLLASRLDRTSSSSTRGQKLVCTNIENNGSYTATVLSTPLHRGASECPPLVYESLKIRR